MGLPLPTSKHVNGESWSRVIRTELNAGFILRDLQYLEKTYPTFNNAAALKAQETSMAFEFL